MLKWREHVVVQTLNVIHLSSSQCLDRSSAAERDTPTIGLSSLSLTSLTYLLTYLLTLCQCRTLKAAVMTREAAALTQPQNVRLLHSASERLDVCRWDCWTDLVELLLLSEDAEVTGWEFLCEDTWVTEWEFHCEETEVSGWVPLRGLPGQWVRVPLWEHLGHWVRVRLWGHPGQWVRLPLCCLFLIYTPSLAMCLVDLDVIRSDILFAKSSLFNVCYSLLVRGHVVVMSRCVQQQYVSTLAAWRFWVEEDQPQLMAHWVCSGDDSSLVAVLERSSQWYVYMWLQCNTCWTDIELVSLNCEPVCLGPRLTWSWCLSYELFSSQIDVSHF